VPKASRSTFERLRLVCDTAALRFMVRGNETSQIPSP
jgi:hypothetical protein